MRGLRLLAARLSASPDVSLWSWATVTDDSPLRVRLDGESAALDVTPDTLVSALAVNDRVWVQLVTNANPARRYRRLVVLGRASGGSPAGSIHVFAGASAPAGYLLCDGSAVSRTTYAVLFGVIGTTYGTGDGSTTFNLPNLKGRVVVGRDTGQSEFNALGETGGAKTHTLTASEMPTHTHAIDSLSMLASADAGGPPSSDNGGNSVAQGATSGRFSHGQTTSGSATASAGSDGAHNNLQPYMALSYVIKI